MTDFSTIQQLWERVERQAPDRHASEIIGISNRARQQVKRKQILSIVILSLLAAGIAVISYLAFALPGNQFFFVLMVMLTAIGIRIGIEIESIHRLNNLNPTSSSSAYTKEVMIFHQWRKKVHDFYTPILVVTYIGSFSSLLSYFRQHVGGWMFIYIVVTLIIGIIIFLFSFYSYRKSELKRIRYLIELANQQPWN